MSSFRVKSTHKLLQNEVTPPSTQSNTYFSTLLDNPDVLKYTYDDNKVPDNSQNRPKSSSTTGMAIRTVVTGQPDHM